MADGNGISKFVKFPISDLPTAVGFILAVVATLIVARRLPIIKKFV